MTVQRSEEDTEASLMLWTRPYDGQGIFQWAKLTVMASASISLKWSWRYIKYASGEYRVQWYPCGCRRELVTRRPTREADYGWISGTGQWSLSTKATITGNPSMFSWQSPSSKEEITLVERATRRKGILNFTSNIQMLPINIREKDAQRNSQMKKFPPSIQFGNYHHAVWHSRKET